MEFAPLTLNIAKLKRKMDIRGLTLQIDAKNVYMKGRFYMLWRNGNFIIIQAEPWWRPGFVPDIALPLSDYLEEHRALWHLQEVIRTMLDTIVFDGENNWAHLVRLKDNSYRLVYKKRSLIQNCPIWTKVVELDDIEMTRFVHGLCWEGVYEGKDVDIFIGWLDDWGQYISAESRGQKLVQSMGVGHYFFDLEAHVSKNGVIIGIMKEPLVGRPVTLADRFVVCEAVADIQRHGILFFFHKYDIYITERGVRFDNACSATHYRDRDALAQQAKCVWEILGNIFDHMDDDLFGDRLSGSRYLGSSTFIIPRLPSPGRPVTLTPEEAIIRWIWSTATSDEFCQLQGCAFIKFYTLYRPSGKSGTRGKRIKGDKRIPLPTDDCSEENETSVGRVRSVDKPLVVDWFRVARHHPFVRPASKRLPLPGESELVTT